MIELNMQSEYRTELKALKKSERSVRKDLTDFAKKCAGELRTMQRNLTRAQKAVQKRLVAITRRRAILEGRLFS